MVFKIYLINVHHKMDRYKVKIIYNGWQFIYMFRKFSKYLHVEGWRVAGFLKRPYETIISKTTLLFETVCSMKNVGCEFWR